MKMLVLSILLLLLDSFTILLYLNPFCKTFKMTKFCHFWKPYVVPMHHVLHHLSKVFKAYM